MAKILLISSKTHPDIAAKQLSVAQTELQRRSIKYDLVKVLHPIDLPSALSIVLESEDYDGIIVCGFIIGPHAQQLVVYQECLRGIQSISLDFATPIGYAIIYSDTQQNALDQHESVTTEAVASCIEIMELKKDLQLGSNEYRFGYQN